MAIPATQAAREAGQIQKVEPPKERPEVERLLIEDARLSAQMEALAPMVQQFQAFHQRKVEIGQRLLAIGRELGQAEGGG